jgi:cell division protease FtsH
MNNNQDNNNNDNRNGFFDKNPILVFVIFSVVTIFAFKSLFPSDDMNVNGGSTAYGQSVNKMLHIQM